MGLCAEANRGSLTRMQPGQSVPGNGQIRLEMQRLLVLRDCLRHTADAFPSDSEIIVRCGGIRCDLQRPFVVMDSLFDLCLEHQGICQAVVGCGRVWLEP